MSSTRAADPQRILVVKLADLGDALVATPALAALRRALPQAMIDVLTTAAGARALDGAALIDHVIDFPKHRFDTPGALTQPRNIQAALRLAIMLKRGCYDTVIILHHLTTRFGALKYRMLAAATGAVRVLGLDNGRGAFLTDRVIDHGYGIYHECDYWLSVVGLLGINTQASYLVPPLPSRSLLAARTGSRRVVLHPGSGTFAPARRWPVARWAALADALVVAGVTVVLVGGPEEAALRATLLEQMRHASAVQDLGGLTTVGQLADVLRQSDLLLGSDSGVVHLAAAVGTPVIAPYGPTDPQAWGPWSGVPWRTVQRFANGVEVWQAGPHTVLHAAIACSPCIYRGHELGTPRGCPDRTCLERITIAQMEGVVMARLTPGVGRVAGSQLLTGLSRPQTP